MMKRYLVYVTAIALAASGIWPATARASLAEDGFTAVPETCEGEELTLTESAVDISFTDRDMDAGYDAFTEILLADGNTSVDGDGAQAEGDVVTITQEGVYRISGSLSDGQIIVDAEDTEKVQLVLDNAKIHCEDHAAIWIKEADKVFITLTEDSENTVSDGTADGDHDDADGAIFSKADLTLQGSGSLTVEGNYKHGIVSKDDLVVTGGNYKITSAEHGLCGKDAVKIADGTIELKAGEHGIRAKNEDDEQQGNVYIAGGTITAESGTDGINATGSIVVNGGEITLAVKDDGMHSDKDLAVYSGSISVPECCEGLEGHRITVYGGDIDVVSTDDGMNASGGDAQQTEVMKNNAPQPEEGNMPKAPEDESTALPHEDGNAAQAPESGNTVQPPGDGEMPGEMMRGRIHSMDGEIPMGGGFGKGGAFDTDKEAYLRICGGNVRVDAGGDGLDSNGYFYMEGGTVQVAGPVGGADGALDYGLTGEASGGTLIAVGSAGMAQGFSDSSEQSSIFYNFADSVSEGSVISLQEENGDEIVSWQNTKAFQSVVITSPELKEGTTYILTAGEETAEVVAGEQPAGMMMRERPAGVEAGEQPAGV
ncbi:MAG: carbohydrate-binding domain-containing protein, partial [Eubacteriales bacterium]|nr:carbohydrate-binding domain-containing protein [Eubacteriales bacterium]